MKDYAERLVSFNNVSPTIFIGLGGSGSDVVNRIAGKLKARWNWHTLQDLIHFFAVDTNTHDLEQQHDIPKENRLLISDFDKRAFVKQKRGDGYQEEDEFVTQWVHPWYGFRGTRGAGAGQIRIESRLSMYYQLEQDRGRIIQRITSAMNTARHHDNPYRKNNPPHFNVFIYGSVAGGTGSGSFLTTAYLMKELITKQNWIPKVYGTLIMPGLFLNQVPGALHKDINANGYAALKELEHLMKLGAEGTRTSERFHYNPNNPQHPEVTDKPFDFVYIADKPATFEIDAYKNAIADAAYLLLYSPILGAQASDYDNYEKHQKGLISGYSVYYGSNGCSVLLLPDEDILHYCAMRYAVKAMSDYLLFQTEGEDEFAINFDDPKFQRMSADGQAQFIDDQFVQFVNHQYRRETEDEIENGPFAAVANLTTPTGGELLGAFDELVDNFVASCTEKLSLPTVSATDIVEANIKIDSEVNDLRNAVNDAKGAIRSVWDSERLELKNGRIIRDFFQTNQTNPFAQRFFLISLKKKLRTDIDALVAKIDGIKSEVDLDSDHVSSEIASWRDRLTETAQWTLGEKLKRKNEDFVHARSGFLQYYNGTLVDGNRALVTDETRLGYLREMLDHAEKRLTSFRSVSTHAAEAIASLFNEAEEARRTGRFRHGEGSSNAYTLDVEALQEIGGERLWNFYFQDQFVSGGRSFNYFDRTKIFEVITNAFNPAQTDDGRREAKAASAITSEIADRLIELGTETLRPVIVGTRSGGKDMSQKGLLLDAALTFEARYHYVRQYEQDGIDQEPTDEQITSYLKEKLRFADTKGNPIASFDGVDDNRVINSVATLVGCHDAYRGQLEPLLEEVLPEASRIPNWYDEKTMVFYHANLGVPLYFYKRINEDMKRDYDICMSKPATERGYPIHIESAWETELMNLDPRDSKSDSQSRERINALLDISIGFATGLFREHEANDIYWHIGTFEARLADDRLGIVKALGSLDDRTKRRVEGALQETKRSITAGEDATLRATLEGYLQELDRLIWAREQAADPNGERLLKFIREEESTLKRWIENNFEH